MYPEIRVKKYYLHPIFTQWYPIFDNKIQGTQHANTGLKKKMIGTPFFGGHVVRWTPYFRGTLRTLNPN